MAVPIAGTQQGLMRSRGRDTPLGPGSDGRKQCHGQATPLSPYPFLHPLAGVWSPAAP